MSVAANQQRILLRLLAGLRPHWRRDRNLPARIQAQLARNRAFGSRDRRLYRELIYTTLRYLPWIEPLLDDSPDEAVRRIAHLAADVPATAAFRAALARGEPPAGDKTELLPAWFRDHCPAIFAPPHLDALLSRAPLWLRLQTADAASVTDEFARFGWRVESSNALPSALRLLDDVDVTKTDAYRSGRVEIQDLGSQLVLESARREPAESASRRSADPSGIAPGGHWLDACAGAGGKTLQLARLLGPAGELDAYDIRPAALRELAARAARAGLRTCHTLYDKPPTAAAPDNCHIMYDKGAATVRLLTQSPTGSYDGVLVDAPCSGSGTWRRAPHLKWTTTDADVTAAATTQLELLAGAAQRVRPGGWLIYATCSLSRRENEDVVAAFLAAHDCFSPEPPVRSFGAPYRGGGTTFLPALHDTDGFFVAALRRR
ncbi:MAG TPA: RsmB/NOP family class I SAM-dependent RNA methyltransferase [Opitutus sp.]|nr:RsmB/NOP family class I SAM-dependent RNA methyltransferase [Opitutus sp.]